MTTFQPIGLRLFDDASISIGGKRVSSARRPDGLHGLSEALTQSGSQASNASALPDFLGAVAGSVSALSGAGTVAVSDAFTLSSASPQAVRVTSVASAAHAQSGGFDSTDAEVKAGTLGLTIAGKTYNISIAQGAKLKDVVGDIQASGAPVDATIANDDGRLRLAITTRATGFNPSGRADDALTISESDTGATGQTLGLVVDHRATNALYTLHGVVQTSTNNLIKDDITGATIDLTNPPVTLGLRLGVGQSGGVLPGGDGQSDSALVSVDSLAAAAQVQSSVFESGGSPVKAGTLSLQVDGKSFDVTINAGDTLADVRRNVENSGANVKAALVNDSGGVRLAITARDSGYPLKGRPEDALTVTEASSGSDGQALNPSVTQAASNAQVTVNGTVTQSRSNTLTDAIPGFALNAQHVSSSPTVVALPALGPRAPLNVENELNRVLQAQLLKPPDLGFSGGSDERGKDDVKQLADASKTTPAGRPADGGTESSRRDIMRKLTAVDNVFGGLKAAQALLLGSPVSGAESTAAAST